MQDMMENHSPDFVQDCFDFADCLKRSFDRYFSAIEESE